MAREPIYVQEIIRSIESARIRITEYGEKFGGRGREYQTRYWIIDPLLKALDWDVHDPDSVWIEYQNGNEFADYAFFVRGNDTPIMILEAKSIPRADLAIEDDEEWEDDEESDDDDEEWEDDEESEVEPDNGVYLGEFNENAVDQLRRQCRGLRRGYGVLSNGSLWSIYDLGTQGNPRTAAGFQRKRIAHCNLLISPPEDCIGALRLLHRRNFR